MKVDHQDLAAVPHGPALPVYVVDGMRDWIHGYLTVGAFFRDLAARRMVANDPSARMFDARGRVLEPDFSRRRIRVTGQTVPGGVDGQIDSVISRREQAVSQGATIASSLGTAMTPAQALSDLDALENAPSQQRLVILVHAGNHRHGGSFSTAITQILATVERVSPRLGAPLVRTMMRLGPAGNSTIDDHPPVNAPPWDPTDQGSFWHMLIAHPFG